MMTQFREHLWRQPVATTLAAYRENLRAFLQPSSSYARHALVKRLPWRGAYNRVFSGWTLVGLLAAVAAYWLRPAATRRERIGLALPILYVAAVSVLFESRENMRYKFFIEPVLGVAMAATAHGLWVALATRKAKGH